MVDSLFISRADGRVIPTEHTRGPWDPRALHGGAAAALIARAFERMHADFEPNPESSTASVIARMEFEFLKPIPFAELELRTEVVRSGRRVRELSAELIARVRRGNGDADSGEDGAAGGEELVGRASALCIQAVPPGLPDPNGRRQLPGPTPVTAMPGPEHGEQTKFALNDPSAESLASTGMEMRWLDDPWSLGPTRVWMRLARPIVGNEQSSPLVRLVAASDFGNGVSRELEFDSYLFINADLAIHLWRAPQGEWIGLDAKTVLMAGGVGTAESVLHDTSGPVARAFQTLVVQPR
jgi:hypothetical protein